jgi:DNA-directed RNA polymerase subunit RPC12/RpoP
MIGKSAQVRCSKCGKMFDAAENRKGAVGLTMQQVAPAGKPRGLSATLTSGAYDCPYCGKRTMIREQSDALQSSPKE